MTRLTSTKTRKIIEYILTTPEFSQIEVSINTEVSIGRVNKIVQWLITKRVITKPSVKYLLVAPNKLIELYSSQITINKLMTYELDIQKEDLIKRLKRHKPTFCLFSALETFDKKFIDHDMHLYNDEHIIKLLNLIPRGQTKVHIYQKPYQPISTSKTTTSKIQTIIDLYAIQNQHLTKQISIQLWNTLQ